MMSIRRCALDAAVLGLFCVGMARAASAEGIDVFALYGSDHRLEVLRDGRSVGRHVLRFEPETDGFRVRSELTIEIPFLFLTAYHYSYRSESMWQDGSLQWLRAETDDNGERSTVQAVRDETGLVVEGPRGRSVLAEELFPTDHWHAGVLGANRVINTITGQVAEVKILHEGRERIETVDASIQADRYRYSGDLENTVWYDSLGRWVGMQFTAQDGSTITYRCRSCTVSVGRRRD